MLTARVEYIPKALFRAESQAQENSAPLSDECLGCRDTLGGALIMAQMSMASQANGTMIAFNVLGVC